MLKKTTANSRMLSRLFSSVARSSLVHSGNCGPALSDVSTRKMACYMVPAIGGGRFGQREAHTSGEVTACRVVGAGEHCMPGFRSRTTSG